MIIVDTSHKWTNAVFAFLWLAYFTQHKVLEVHPVCPIVQDSLLLYAHNTFSLSASLPTGTCIVDTCPCIQSWLPWPMRQWTWEGIYLFKILISIFRIIYPEVLLGAWCGVLFLIFWETSIVFCIATAPFCILVNTVQGSHFLYHHLLSYCFSY